LADDELSTAAKQLISSLPELHSIFGPLTEKKPYEVLGALGVWLLHELSAPSSASNQQTIDKAFEFLNSTAEAKDPNVAEALVVAVMEVLRDDPESVRACRVRLRGKALLLFEEAFEFWEQST
jgi:hypothetical protein